MQSGDWVRVIGGIFYIRELYGVPGSWAKSRIYGTDPQRVIQGGRWRGLGLWMATEQCVGEV